MFHFINYLLCMLYITEHWYKHSLIYLIYQFYYITKQYDRKEEYQSNKFYSNRTDTFFFFFLNLHCYNVTLLNTFVGVSLLFLLLFLLSLFVFFFPDTADVTKLVIFDVIFDKKSAFVFFRLSLSSWFTPFLPGSSTNKRTYNHTENIANMNENTAMNTNAKTKIWWRSKEAESK